MWAVFKKEWMQFFSSLTAYISVGVFLIVMGLNVFVFEGNVLESGYATLDVFFGLAPWIMIFLVPAITMRSFSEEFHSGTIEMLVTKPLSDIEIILAKYFAAVGLVIFTLLPTLIYFLAVYLLSVEGAGIDVGATWGSYIGLVMLGMLFAALGIWASTFSSNQIVAFIAAVCLCYFVYDAFFRISSLPFFTGRADFIIQSLGAGAHYDALSRGVVDAQDILYFLTVSCIMIMLTKVSLKIKKS